MSEPLQNDDVEKTRELVEQARLEAQFRVAEVDKEEGWGTAVPAAEADAAGRDPVAEAFGATEDEHEDKHEDEDADPVGEASRT